MTHPNIMSWTYNFICRSERLYKDLSEKMTEKDLTLICANFEEFQTELHNVHSGIQTIQETSCLLTDQNQNKYGM